MMATTMHDTPPAPEELLARFGLDGFRRGQREAVEAALKGKDIVKYVLRCRADRWAPMPPLMSRP
jgi:hypothetical protein